MLSRDRSSGVVLKYYVYTAVRGPGFIYPVYVLYALAQGLTFTQLGVISSVQAIIMFAGEIPTGYVGDRVGRRNSLALANVSHLLSAGILIFADDFLSFTVGFVLLSIGLTFESGSGSAWLYDTLEQTLDEEEAYTRIRGRGEAISQWGTATTMIAGGLLYVAGQVLPFVALFLMRGVTLATVFLLPKNAQYTAGSDGAEAASREESAEDDSADPDADGSDDEGPGETVGVREVLPTLRERLTDPSLRSFVLYMTIFFGATIAVDTYVQPITVEALERTAAAVPALRDLPKPALLGVLYASFTATAGVAGEYADTVQRRLGLRTVVLGVPIAVGVLLVAPLGLAILAVPVFFAVRSSRLLIRPVAEQYLHDRIGSADRATVLSAVSMVYGIGRVPFLLASGVVADATSSLGAIAVLGAMLLVGSATVFLLSSPVQERAETVTPAATEH